MQEKATEPNLPRSQSERRATPKNVDASIDKNTNVEQNKHQVDPEDGYPPIRNIDDAKVAAKDGSVHVIFTLPFSTKCLSLSLLLILKKKNK